MPLLGELPQGGGELAAAQIARQQGAYDGVSKVSHGLAVVSGLETGHREMPFCTSWEAPVSIA
jgi:hypothetical protein